MSFTLDRQPAAAAHRRRRARDAAERLVERAEHLDPPDRLLIRQIYLHGCSVAEIARARDVPPRNLQRHVAHLLHRMKQPAFTLVAEKPELLPAAARAAARCVVLQGQSLRQTARHTRQSLHRVRQHIHTVQTLAHI